MTKKNKRILIIFLVIGLVFLIFFILNRTFFQNSSIKLSEFNPFPFGDRLGSETETDTEPNQTTDTTLSSGDGFISLSRNRLRQITSFPVSGYKIFTSQEEILSQESINLYNSSRGNVSEINLSTISVPKIRLISQKIGNVIDIYAGNQIEEIQKVSFFLPEHEESFVTGIFGQDIFYRFYNERNLRIQSFLVQLTDSIEPEICSRNLENENFEINLNQLNYFLEINKQPPIKNAKDPNDLIPEFQKLFKKNEIVEIDGFKKLIAENCLERRKNYEEFKFKNINSDDGTFLSDFISHADSHPNSNLLTGIIPSDITSSVNIFSGNNPTQGINILKSYFSEWILQWVNDNTITLTTASSYFAPGFIYSLNPKTGSLDKVLGDKFGFTTLTSPDGRYILYSEIINKKLALKMYDRIKNKEYVVGKNTLPEKCSWSSDQQKPTVYCGVPRNIEIASILPDEWYKEDISFSDDIWVFRLEDENNRSLSSSQLLQLDSVDTNFDMYKLKLSPDNKFLFFLDKKNNYLWSFEIDGLVSQ